MKALEKSILDYDNQIENLKKLGEFHAQKNVVPPHFDVVLQALLMTLSQLLGDQFDDDLK